MEAWNFTSWVSTFFYRFWGCFIFTAKPSAKRLKKEKINIQTVRRKWLKRGEKIEEKGCLYVINYPNWSFFAPFLNQRSERDFVRSDAQNYPRHQKSNSISASELHGSKMNDEKLKNGIIWFEIRREFSILSKPFRCEFSRKISIKKKFHLHFSFFSFPPRYLRIRHEIFHFRSRFTTKNIFHRTGVSKFQCFNISANVARFFSSPQKDIIFVNFHFYFITFSFGSFFPSSLPAHSCQDE